MLESNRGSDRVRDKMVTEVESCNWVPVDDPWAFLLYYVDRTYWQTSDHVLFLEKKDLLFDGALREVKERQTCVWYRSFLESGVGAVLLLFPILSNGEIDFAMGEKTLATLSGVYCWSYLLKKKKKKKENKLFNIQKLLTEKL